MSPRIEALDLTAHQRFDSRGRPTVMVNLQVNGRYVRAFVPSGASTGINEAIEKRDGGDQYLGLGVKNAVESVQEIASAIKDLDVFGQTRIDQTMIDLDGKKNKSRLGANAILAVSLGVAHAAAEHRNVPLFKYVAELYGNEHPSLLPTPMMNVINGGVHAKNGLPFQEFMIVPTGAGSFAEAMRIGSEVYGTLGKIIASSGVGDEGGFSPSSFKSNSGVGKIKDALALLSQGIERAGYTPGKDIAIALDPASSEFYREGKYHLSDNEILTSMELVDLFQELIEEHPIISVEDGMAQNDDLGWRLFFDRFGHRLQIVGDDRYCTTLERIEEGISDKEANAVLIKLNQVGTLTETLAAIRAAQEAGWNTVISHRSGETEDTTIADLAVATSSGQIKTGAPARGERTAKYNRLLNIEEIELPRLKLVPKYAGKEPFRKLAIAS